MSIFRVVKDGLGPGGLESMVVAEAAKQSEETALGAAMATEVCSLWTSEVDVEFWGRV